MSAGPSSLCSTVIRAYCPAKQSLEQGYCLWLKARNSYGETPCNVSEEDTLFQKEGSNQTVLQQWQFGALLIRRENFPPLFPDVLGFNLSAITTAQWRLNLLTAVIIFELLSSSHRTTKWGKAWVPTGVKKFRKQSEKLKSNYFLSIWSLLYCRAPAYNSATQANIRDQSSL